MSPTRWIFGCTLLAAVSSPSLAARAASDMGAQDLGQHTSARARTIDSGATNGGDLSAPSTSHGNDAPAGASSDGGNNDGSGSLPVSTGSRQAPSSHSNVGWQSLLPGSIQ